MMRNREATLPRTLALQHIRNPAPYQLHQNNARLSYAKNGVVIDREQRQIHHYPPPLPILRNSSLQISACESPVSMEDETQDRYADMKQEDVETRDNRTLVNWGGMADTNRKVVMGMQGVQGMAHGNDAIRNANTDRVGMSARPQSPAPRLMDQYPTSTVTFSNRDTNPGHPVTMPRQSSPNIMMENVGPPYNNMHHGMYQGRPSHMHQHGQQTMQPFGRDQPTLPQDYNDGVVAVAPKRTMLV